MIIHFYLVQLIPLLKYGNINNIYYIFRLKSYYLNIDDKWGLGIGDWGLGIGDWGLGPIPNPQSPCMSPPLYIWELQQELLLFY